jgi:hypothetical protein
MKNVVFWDINPQFLLHRRLIASPLQRLAGLCYVRFEVFPPVTLKNVVFWDFEEVIPSIMKIQSARWEQC